MKHWKKICTVLFTTVIVSLGTATMAFAAETGQIQVSGSGVVLVDPDSADISLSITTNGSTANQAQQKNNQILQSVTSAMRQMGISDEDMQTTYSYVSPAYSYDPTTDTSTITGYRANTQLQVTTTDIDHTGKYIDTALKAGATGTNGVSFYLADESAYYAEALQAAVKSADASAHAIAAAYGKQLGTVLSVTEISRNTYYTESFSTNSKAMATDAIAEGSSSGTEVLYGKVSVSADLSVIYAF